MTWSVTAPSRRRRVPCAGMLVLVVMHACGDGARPRRPARPFSETSTASSLLDPGWIAKLLSREIGGTIRGASVSPKYRNNSTICRPPIADKAVALIHGDRARASAAACGRTTDAQDRMCKPARRRVETRAVRIAMASAPMPAARPTSIPDPPISPIWGMLVCHFPAMLPWSGAPASDDAWGRRNRAWLRPPSRGEHLGSGWQK